jgi:hypothetical protein|tara:strand:+ start:3401 stop:4060 length:660 start_codon:yes stop_codon:yes gene_type:complete
MEQRIEKKFVFLPGDKRKIDQLKIEGFFKKIYFNRRVNSIYFDTIDLNCLWDNINGFSNRNKFRVRWYDNIQNSEVFFEKKTKINQTTQKIKISLGKFKNEDDLNSFLKSNDFVNAILKITSLNLVQVLNVSYNRDYFIDTENKLRITFDQKITTHQNSEGKFYKNFADVSNNILEFKYANENSKYVRKKMYDLNFNVRNQKFSKYVQSFMILNEMGHN